MKACTRCRTIKPAESFRANKRTKDGLHGWCKDCAQQAHRQWKQDHPDHKRAENELAKGLHANPLVYTQHACNHIASVAQKAITRFELKTQQEAPPHLTAILELATQYANELPAKPPRTLPDIVICAWCNTPYQPKKRGHAVYCSNRCKMAVKHARRRALLPAKPPKPAPPPKPQPTLKACEHCGTEFLGHTNKRYCNMDCWYRAYYQANRDKYIQTALNRYHRLKDEAR